MDVQTAEGTVKVTNMPMRTIYYRGRYFRTTITVATTPTRFRQISRSTFFGHQASLRWWDLTGEAGSFFGYHYDSSQCTWETPF